MAKNNKDYIYVAFDSDVLRELVYLYILQGKERNLVANLDGVISDKEFVVRHKEHLQQTLQLIRTGVIRPVIVNTIYQESKHSKSLMEFVERYFYAPEESLVNSAEYGEQVKQLANLYCEPYTDWNGNLIPAPLKKVYNSYVGKKIPTNDVFAVAEAVCARVNFVTFNAKDLVFDRKHGEGNWDRSDGVTQISKLNGYYELCEDGRKFGLTVMAHSRFANLIKNGIQEYHNNLANDERFVPFSECAEV